MLRPYINKYVRPFFDSFWNQSPALFYGIFLYLAACSAFSWHIALLVPVFFLALLQSTVQKWRFLLGFLASVLFWLYAVSHVVFPPIWGDSVQGQATFEIVDWVHDFRYNKAYCKMKVHVHSFEAENGQFFAKNIPCKLVWNNPGSRPNADTLYLCKACLKEFNGTWTLKLSPNSPLQKKEELFSLAEWRHRAKNSVKQILAKYLAPSQTRAFLEGVLIGEFHDNYLAGSLKRFGLQHITVVSGFHFSLIAIILASFFRLILPWKLTNICLLIGTTAYLLFIGPSSSVLRAWVAVTILFLGKLFEKNANGMNCLGLGLILVLCLDPACTANLGFQLSFLATFAILLFYPFVQKLLRGFFPNRSASQVVKMPFSEQVLFVLLTFFVSSLALVASVSILMLPMSLYCFGQFPLVGIIYNCFFPFLVSIAVFLVCLAFLFLWIPSIAAVLFWIAALIIDSALTLINHAPKWCDIILQASWISGGALVIYLCLVSAFGIIFTQKQSNN